MNGLKIKKRTIIITSNLDYVFLQFRWLVENIRSLKTFKLWGFFCDVNARDSDSDKLKIVQCNDNLEVAVNLDEEEKESNREIVNDKEGDTSDICWNKSPLGAWPMVLYVLYVFYHCLKDNCYECMSKHAV